MRQVEGMRDDTTLDISAPCSHVPQISFFRVERPARGCEECLRVGGSWVHLRECLICGHVGCCDSSPNQHATKHFQETGHPIISSAEPGEHWCWCYLDERPLG
jgi:uncharacterized UBP type Zn finger protein